MRVNKKYYPIILLVIFLVVAQGYVIYKRSLIEQDFNTTIARVTGKQKLLKSSPSLFYEYYVDSEIYTGSFKFDGTFSEYENNYYHVKYSSENSSWSEILLNRPVTDTNAIKAAGFDLPKEKINQFQEK